MRTMLKRLILLLAAGFLARPAAAISDRTGMEGAQFLRLGPDARAAAMGEAFTAIASGPDALYWNPGGMAGLQAPGLAVSHAEYLGIFRHETVYVASTSSRLNGTIGLGLSYLTQDSIDAFDKNGDATGDSFSPGSVLVSAGYARELRTGPFLLSAGGAFTWLHETLWNDSASAFALDLGVEAVHERAPGWQFGAVLRHLGTGQRFIDKTAHLPTELGLGVAYEPLNKWKGWTILAEEAVPYYAPAHTKLGLERRFTMKQGNVLAARCGLNTRTLSSLGSMSAVSFGFGLYLKRASWDFAFHNQGDLGSVYRLGFGWSFGKGPEAAAQEVPAQPAERPAAAAQLPPPEAVPALQSEVMPAVQPAAPAQPAAAPAEALEPAGTIKK